MCSPKLIKPSLIVQCTQLMLAIVFYCCTQLMLARLKTVDVHIIVPVLVLDITAVVLLVIHFMMMGTLVLVGRYITSVVFV